MSHHHRHGAHQHGDPADGTNAEQWEARYAGSDRIWSGKPNALLVEHASALAPGAALELGCGEGADAIWLARQGWTVLATDVAQAALTKAAEHAASAGVDGCIAWERHDLESGFPAGSFDLVLASYLHSSHPEFDRVPVLRRAAGAVAAGGRLLVISHAGAPPWAGADPSRPQLPNAAQTVELIGLGDDWAVEIAADVDVPRPAPDGSPSTRPDCVVLARRLT